MNILLVNEWYNPCVQNLIEPFTLLFSPCNFNWTGKRYMRADYLPLSEIEKSSLLSEPEALTMLQDGHYDFVIMSDSTTLIYTSSHFKNTKRIFVDSLDCNFIPRSYYENSELYFKCQPLKSGKYKIVNTKGNDKEYYASDHIHPFCLGTSFKYSKYKDITPQQQCFDVSFVGSAWPKERVEYIEAIKNNKEIVFFGGLFNRQDLSFNVAVPDRIKFNQISQIDYVRSILMSKTSLSLKGNGENCYRQFEIMALGQSLLLNQSNIDNLYSHNNLELITFNNTSEMIDLIKYYISNEDKRSEAIDSNKLFYENNLSPMKMASYMKDIINAH